MSTEFERLLSVVVIGLNEEDHLKDSLDSVVACRPADFELEVIYVDSGSTDRSVEIASFIPGVLVLHLNPVHPSAAKARNLGLRHARGRYVQLVDGDSVVQPGWLDIALKTLEERPGVSCVFGQCIEMYPDQSIYMKVCGLDWHVRVGECRYCGGNSMWRAATLASVDYFDEELKFGEEPDLCYRVRQDGWKIISLGIPMVMHDLGMRTFQDYWKRASRSGSGYAKLAARYWRRREKLWLRELIMTYLEPSLWVVLFTAGWYFKGLWTGAAFVSVWLAFRTAQIGRAMRSRNLSAFHSALYGLHCQFVRLPAALAQLKAHMAAFISRPPG